MSTKPKPRYVTPTLESITIRGKYRIHQTDFNIVTEMVRNELPPVWTLIRKIGESVAFANVKRRVDEKDLTKVVNKRIKELRFGVPFTFHITTVEHYNDGILVDVECRPVMWYTIAREKCTEETFTQNQIQEALLECKIFVKQVMSIFRGKEIEPVSVYPIIQRTEIKSRLLNLGLKEIVDKLDKAERHIVQNNFTDSLKSSRTAFEKMIDWQMEKRGLEKTNNCKNDLERLKSKGYLDAETTRLLQSSYRCLSNIGVHEKEEIQAGIFEAQMGYGITLIILDYFANKLP